MRIASVEHSVPTRKVTNDDIYAAIGETNRDVDAATVAHAAERLRNHLALAGTEVRYMLDDDEQAIDHIIAAGTRALATAEILPGDVDLVIYAGVGRGWLEPSMASVVQHALGLSNATGFDVLDACAGWLRALQVAHGFISSGLHSRALIVNCECALRSYVDLRLHGDDEFGAHTAAFTIGEAATATVVDRPQDRDDFYFTFRNFGEHFDLCMIPLETMASFVPRGAELAYEPGKFHSRSERLIATTINKIADVFHSDNRLNGAEYDICFGHAASERAKEILAQKLGLPQELYYSTHSRFGNTVSSSVPLAMSLALAEGRLQRGDRTLVIVGSAGISVGFSAFTF